MTLVPLDPCVAGGMTQGQSCKFHPTLVHLSPGPTKPNITLSLSLQILNSLGNFDFILMFFSIMCNIRVPAQALQSLVKSEIWVSNLLGLTKYYFGVFSTKKVLQSLIFVCIFLL